MSQVSEQATSLGACLVLDLARKSGDGIVLRQRDTYAGKEKLAFIILLFQNVDK